MKRLYAASELAKMGLPGLPGSKAAIMAKADREGWRYEERSGRGGMHRAYEVPARYWVESGGIDQEVEAPRLNEVAGQKAKRYLAQNRMTDSEIVEQIALGVENWIKNNGLTDSPERKAALVALLFSYFREEGGVTTEKLEEMLKKVA
ncbi:hypothetical protein BLA9940_02607 [Burkholderia aenigmatica]|uniref:DNA-binding protein n=1 Tax=Burkholderia cepacia complex TaxID=87882 RepID=UPI0013DE671D|nr:MULTISPECIES: DNA-binding protein [Burkholderia cepacia complex]VWC57516.1 hypothetical protein BLA9940_02607 [Burkholderia aenigmatica]